MANLETWVIFMGKLAAGHMFGAVDHNTHKEMEDLLAVVEKNLKHSSVWFKS